MYVFISTLHYLGLVKNLKYKPFNKYWVVYLPSLYFFKRDGWLNTERKGIEERSINDFKTSIKWVKKKLLIYIF